MEEVQAVATVATTSDTDIMLYVTGTAMVIAALMTMLPKPATESGVYYYIYKLLNMIAMNFGQAKNAK